MRAATKPMRMAQSDRERLLAQALALPQAAAADFHGERTPPRHADPALLKKINDTALRTKLTTVGLAEGLQSPKGPQKIASIVRIYPAFDAPTHAPTNGRPAKGRGRPSKSGRPASRRPTVDELERLLLRYRETEHAVSRELGGRLDDQIAHLKRRLAELDGEPLEEAYRELGAALDRKRASAAQIAAETFARVGADEDFPEREYLTLLAR